MFRSFSLNILFILFSAAMIFSSCGKKEESQNNTGKDNKSGAANSDLVVKDETGTRVNLTLKPKVGEVFKYHMNAVTTTKEKGPQSNEKELVNSQNINYYYSEEVSEISSAGIVTYKIKFDSINISTNITAQDTSFTLNYNSNIKDSSYSRAEFVQYNAIMNEEIFVRVAPQGEISELYGLENVYENMFKALGDTLDFSEKESIKKGFGKEAIQAVIQQQFQIFPDDAVYVDSSWTRAYETQIIIFPVRNSLSYKLTGLQEENGQFIASIDADLNVDFIEKDAKDENMSYKIEDVKTGGKGSIEFNLTRGCVKTKKTNTNIEINVRLSAQGQSIKTFQSVNTALSVNLMQ